MAKYVSLICQTIPQHAERNSTKCSEIQQMPTNTERTQTNAQNACPHREVLLFDSLSQNVQTQCAIHSWQFQLPASQWNTQFQMGAAETKPPTQGDFLTTWGWDGVTGEGSAGQPHTDILIQVDYNVHFPKIQNAITFMIWGANGNVKGPLNRLFLTLDPSNYSN